MNSITSEAHFRQRVLKYSYKKTVTEASRRFHVSRNAIYEWRAKYDGSWKNLMEKSHRLHHHPNEHTKEEKEMILRRYPRYKDDMIMLWDKSKDFHNTHSNAPFRGAKSKADQYVTAVFQNVLKRGCSYILKNSETNALL